MAKGDKKKMQNTVNTQVNTAQQGLDRLTNEAIIPSQQQNQAYYTRAADQSFNDYNDIMNRYRGLADEGVTKNQPGLERVNYNRNPEMNEAFGGYRNFMNTGGYSPEDIMNMRARGVSPIRASYANALNEIDRQKNLAGGYSPNAGALRASMARSQGSQMADAVQNVNAQLAEAINRGKQFGISGMGGLSVQDAELAQRAALANQAAGLDIARNNLMDPRMSAVSGMANLYGTTPGAANMFGNQAQQSINNWLNSQGQQQGIGQMAIGGQQAVAQTPSNFETAFGRVGQGLQMGGQIAGAFMGLPGGSQLPGGGMDPGSMAGVYSPYGMSQVPRGF